MAITAKDSLERFHEDLLRSVNRDEVNTLRLFGAPEKANVGKIQLLRINTAARVRSIMAEAEKDRVRGEIIFESYADQLFDRAILEDWLEGDLKQRLAYVCINPADPTLLAYLKAQGNLEIFQEVWGENFSSVTSPLPTEGTGGQVKTATIIFLCELKKLQKAGVGTHRHMTAGLATLLICANGNDIAEHHSGRPALSAIHNSKIHRHLESHISRGKSLNNILEEFRGMTPLKKAKKPEDVQELIATGKIDSQFLPRFIIRLRRLLASEITTNPVEVERTVKLIHDLETVYFERSLGNFVASPAPELGIQTVWEKIQQELEAERTKPLRGVKQPAETVSAVLMTALTTKGKPLLIRLATGLGEALRALFKKGRRATPPSA